MEYTKLIKEFIETGNKSEQIKENIDLFDIKNIKKEEQIYLIDEIKNQNLLI